MNKRYVNYFRRDSEPTRESTPHITSGVIPGKKLRVLPTYIIQHEKGHPTANPIQLKFLVQLRNQAKIFKRVSGIKK